MSRDMWLRIQMTRAYCRGSGRSGGNKVEAHSSNFCSTIALEELLHLVAGPLLQHLLENIDRSSLFQLQNACLIEAD